MTGREQETIDPITAQVIGGRFYSACLEAGRKLQRMSFSSIIRESEDYGVVLTDAEGHQLTEISTTPLMMGCLVFCARGVMKLVKELGDTIYEGDVWIHNDAYYGASHSPDIAIVTPAFHRGELIGFAVTQAHAIDTGGSKPGSSSIDAVDTYAEGLRLRAIKVYEKGKRNEWVWRYIRDNVRVPDMIIGDLEAQVAAANLAAERYAQIMEEFGKENVAQATAWLADYSERMLREAIARLPDGVYCAEGFCDGYPAEDDPLKKNIKIAVTLTISGSELSVDLTGSAAQVPDRCINMPFEGTVHTCVMTVVRSLLLDEAIHGFIPQNDGIWRAIKVTAPLGSIANPTFPTATIARFQTGQCLANTLMKAFSQAAPELACAGCAHLCAFIYAGVAPTGSHWVFFDLLDSSHGAMDGMDGYDAVDSLYINTRNVPIEDIESHYPVRVLESQLRLDEPAPGKFRGGLGTQRALQHLGHGWCSAESDGTVHAPWGLFGGSAGRVAEISINPGSVNPRRLDSKFTGLAMKPGDVLYCRTGSSGAYGDPLERDPQKVLSDYLDDLISAESARRDYKVVIDVQHKALDLAATHRLRAERHVGGGQP